mgnify:CR=1 FL=1
MYDPQTNDPSFPLTAPTVTRTAVKFTHNSVDFQFKHPNFDNKFFIQPKKNIKRSRRGDLIVFHHDHFTTYRLTYLFENVGTLFSDFLYDSLGQSMTLLDHEGRTWTGFIINPAEAIQQLSDCHYSVRIEFDGSLTSPF